MTSEEKKSFMTPTLKSLSASASYAISLNFTTTHKAQKR